MAEDSGSETAGLFATDMDGTLLQPEGGFHDDDLRALESLGRMGFLRVIATGRSPFSFRRMMGRRVLPVDYLVLSSGAFVMDYRSGSCLKSSSMDGELTDRLVEWLVSRNYDFCVQSTGHDSHAFSYCYASGANPDMERRIELYRGHCGPLASPDGSGPSTQIVVILPSGAGEDRLKEFNSHLGGDCSILRTTSPLDGESMWIEIFPPGISKSRGVAWIAQRHGISPADTAAVGNDYNDHDLLEWAGHAFVVEDSPEHLRTSFTEVTSVGRGAVAQAARLWLMERGQLSGEENWPSS
ncbi:MAG: HAD family hydrolase [Candidatus Aegiribacteria sp.]